MRPSKYHPSDPVPYFAKLPSNPTHIATTDVLLASRYRLSCTPYGEQADVPQGSAHVSPGVIALGLLCTSQNLHLHNLHLHTEAQHA